MTRLIPVLLLLAPAVAGCSKGASGDTALPQAPAGKSSGWEIKYTAVVALARRGSDRVKDHFDTLLDMLDESQQQANCKTKGRDGRDVVNDQAATSNVTTALKAVVELHRRRPEMDLTQLTPAIGKLTQSGNPVIRTEAEKTKLALGQK
jgi:hypothetical protein